MHRASLYMTPAMSHLLPECLLLLRPQCRRPASGGVTCRSQLQPWLQSAPSPVMIRKRGKGVRRLGRIDDREPITGWGCGPKNRPSVLLPTGRAQGRSLAQPSC